MTIETQPADLRGIQVLRFVAVLLVVVLHANNRTHWIHPGYDIKPLGFLEAGVDIFFVISGFIMVHIMKPDTRPLDFAKRRLLRIVPLYWVLTALAFVLSVSFPSYFFKAYDVVHAVGSALFLPMPGVLLGVGWSLNFEVAFYLALAACLFARERWLPTIFVVLGLWVVICAIFYGRVRPLTYYANGALFLEFGMGMAVAYLTKTVAAPRPTVGLALAVVGLMLIPFAWNSTTNWPRALLLGLPAMVVVAGTVWAEPLFRGRGSRLFVFLGDASYSIYLAHLFAITPVARLLRLGGGYGLASLPPSLTIAALVPIGLLAGVIVYYAIERPLRHATRQRLRHATRANAAVS